MLAKGALLKPRRLTISLGDCHIYNNHLDQVKEQLSRNIKQLPKIKLGCGIFERDNELVLPKKEDVMLFDYSPHKPIKAELSVGT
jgi:thymidylate synthase